MINKENTMENLYDWLFHYNPYTKVWNAFRRDESSQYFNGELENVLSSKNYNTLIDIIHKTGGDPKKILWKIYMTGYFTITLILKFGMLSEEMRVVSTLMEN
jgi:hypothetical protein